MIAPPPLAIPSAARMTAHVAHQLQPRLKATGYRVQTCVRRTPTEVRCGVTFTGVPKLASVACAYTSIVHRHRDGTMTARLLPVDCSVFR